VKGRGQHQQRPCLPTAAAPSASKPPHLHDSDNTASRCGTRSASPQLHQSSAGAVPLYRQQLWTLFNDTASSRIYVVHFCMVLLGVKGMRTTPRQYPTKRIVSCNPDALSASVSMRRTHILQAAHASVLLPIIPSVHHQRPANKTQPPSSTSADLAWGAQRIAKSRPTAITPLPFAALAQWRRLTPGPAPLVCPQCQWPASCTAGRS
jgi:hypothetical protein